MRRWRSFFALSLILLAASLAVSCATTPPRNTVNSCAIFGEKDGWGVPIHVQLAIIYQESRFVHDAKPPRKKLLWVIPWTRLSSAYGYGQIKDGTWDWYRKSTGNRWADRDDFDDVVDFIGWYVDVSHRKLGISKSDAYNQYLAYHEGHGGFKRKTYKRKPWLIKVAKKVASRASAYRAQLRECESELDRGWWIF